MRLHTTTSPDIKAMASPKEEHGSPHGTSPSDSSDDSDSSQGSDSMVRVAGEDGPRVAKHKTKKGDGEPKKEKRRKAKRACRPCQVAHLTCSQSQFHFMISRSLMFCLMAHFPFQKKSTNVVFRQVTTVHARGASSAAAPIHARMECERKQSIYKTPQLKHSHRTMLLEAGQPLPTPGFPSLYQR